ncbi:MAG: biosynthetic arginine decarboxylase [Gammaproteobacteria bacterium]|nr:biosynthetic arginine decarboxylase [Gammaproteobacteria bacterium]
MIDWTLQKARDAYNIAHWSGGYFDINDRGHLVCRPDARADRPGIDLYELSKEIKAADLSLPVLVRFSDILRHRVETLCQAFDRAMQADGYRGRYTAVYPIKVNQQKSVVEKILARNDGRVGLEAGSKPELLAVLALSRQDGGVVVCNGYKDREYIRLALIGRQLGLRVYIVVEKQSELERVLQEARALGVRPLLGVRVRLASIGAGKWQNTGGEKSKFGLSAAQALAVVERLREAGMLDALQLLHFHLGSQIANIRDIQLGLRECARYYAELRRLGANVECVDVGGGLGIDYEGTRSRSFCSMNYSVQEYANNVVHALWEMCADQGLPHPHVVTESGRAMTAHHAVLITNVIDIESVPEDLPAAAANADEPRIIQDLWRGLEGLSGRSALEVYHDAGHWLAQAQHMYTHGLLTLAQRARAEQLYLAVCRKVRELLQPGVRAHREVLDELNDKLVDKYFCNFSLFQSMPDVWAIDQIFPVVPLHRLSEPPTRRAVIEDLTCDSDGHIEYYVNREGVETCLPLPPYRPGEPLLLGMFLVGAYQEILGDMHNLFGDTDSVNLELTPDGGYRLAQPLRGDTVDSVLRYVRFNADELLRAYRAKSAAAVLSDEQRRVCLKALEEGLRGYTYLEE